MKTGLGSWSSISHRYIHTYTRKHTFALCMYMWERQYVEVGLINLCGVSQGLMSVVRGQNNSSGTRSLLILPSLVIFPLPCPFLLETIISLPQIDGFGLGWMAQSNAHAVFHAYLLSACSWDRACLRFISVSITYCLAPDHPWSPAFHTETACAVCTVRNTGMGMESHGWWGV